MPPFMTERAELRVLRRLHGAAYGNARCYPEDRTTDRFAEPKSVTPLGWRVLGIVRRSLTPGGG